MKVEDIIKIGEWFEKSGLQSLDWKEGEASLSLVKAECTNLKENLNFRDSSAVSKIENTGGKQLGENIPPRESECVCKNISYVKAPVVGSFYAASSPDEEAFVKKGDIVEQGQVVCIIEAMKLFNEIVSPVSGKVTNIFKKNGDFVEFDENLIEIEVR